MYVIWVEFRIRSQHTTEFLGLVRQNAATSLEEPGCQRFDVCVSCDDEAQIALYEIYDDRAAFDYHLATTHFRQFDAAVADWVESKRVVAYHL